MSKERFKKNHFLVIKQAIDPKVANFVFNYFMMKRQVTKTMFDFSIEMSALDSNGSFFCHPTFEHDMNNKILTRNLRPYGYPRQSNRRLLKYIKDGFTIDQENLLLWLENQEASFEYRRRLKNK